MIVLCVGLVERSVRSLCYFPFSDALSCPCCSAVCMRLFAVCRAPTIFLAPSGLLRRFASSQYNGSMIGLADVPGYLTSMVFLKLYPTMLKRGGWALPIRVMQVAVVLGGLMNAWVWKLEADNPTTEPIA